MKSLALYSSGSVLAVALSTIEAWNAWLRLAVLFVTLLLCLKKLFKGHQPPFVRAVLLFALAGLLWAGCASSPAQMTAQDAWYQAATNRLESFRPVVGALPPPYGSLGGAGLALAVAGLGAWNTYNHRRVSRLTAAAPK